MDERFDPVSLEILWNRLIAIADEAATTLLRTAFSPVVRESYDFVCVLLDAQGNSLAQASFGPPSFLGTLPITVRHFLRAFPHDQWSPGDVVVTNDPWMGTGHLPDINVAIPIFYRDRLVAFAASVAHAPDIGGRIRAVEARDLFEEGLRIPITKIYKAGQPNEDVLNMIRHNVRIPDQVLGDLRAQVAANEVAARRVVALMDEYGLDDLNALAGTVHSLSERAFRKAIADLPDGDYPYEVKSDGYNEPLTIKATVSVVGDSIKVDYTGTSPQVRASLNVVPNYTFSYTYYPLKCVLSPHIPNNEGCFKAVEVTAPEGSLLNPRFPAAVSTRGLVAHFLPMAVLGALAQVVPDRVIAPSGNPPWATQFFGLDKNNKSFSTVFFFAGGQGASAHEDGISCSTFPSNISNTSIEIIESESPYIMIDKKEFRQDSGGAGAHRGGLGQILSMTVAPESTLTVALFGDRTEHPAPGLLGGKPGAPGEARLNGRVIKPKGQVPLNPGDHLTFATPGGGGFGLPEERALEDLREDLLEGFVSVEAVCQDYGTEIAELDLRELGYERELQA